MELLRKWKKRNKKSQLTSRKMKEEITTAIFKSPHHQWIIESAEISRAFRILIDSFEGEHLNKMHASRNIYFVLSNHYYSCALSLQKNHGVILIFPELFQLLKSASYLSGVAVLAHELGHLLLGHHQDEVDPIDSQVKADSFTYELGFGVELLDMLEDEPASMEQKIRITYLTSLLYAKSDH